MVDETVTNFRKYLFYDDDKLEENDVVEINKNDANKLLDELLNKIFLLI